MRYWAVLLSSPRRRGPITPVIVVGDPLDYRIVAAYGSPPSRGRQLRDCAGTTVEGPRSILEGLE